VNRQRGISIIETLIVMGLILFVMATTFAMIIRFGESQKTDYARVRLSEESRFMFNAFAEQLKDSGSILTLAHSNSFLSDTPYFNGIFPLDKTDGPDGVIMASGDPLGTTTLTADFAPSATTINVKSTFRKDGVTAAWKIGDRGIVLSTQGYYVFAVTGVASTALTIRDSAVYYSGLLNNCGYYGYTDTLQTPAVSKGNAITYTGTGATPKTPVIRLTDFSIYVFNQIFDNRLKRNVNRLYRIFDSNGVSGVGVLANASVVSDSIYDLQISYTFFTAFPLPAPSYTLLGAVTPVLPAPYGADTVYSLIQKKMLKQTNVTIVVLTDEYGGTDQYTVTVPAIENRGSYSLPSGKYNYKVFSFNVQNKNYNIVI
jgi:hypothetical protein